MTMQWTRTVLLAAALSASFSAAQAFDEVTIGTNFRV